MYSKEEIRLKGIKISEGIVLAEVCLFNTDRHYNLKLFMNPEDDHQNEKNRLQKAITMAEQQLENLISNVAKRLGKAEANIFMVQKMIVADAELHKEMFSEISNVNRSAEGAVTQVFDSYEKRLLAIDDEYLKTKTTDITEVKNRLLDILSETNPQLICSGAAGICEKGQGRIIVAKELTPSLTIGLETSSTKGFVTEHGGKLSHAAILARALGVPAVSGIKNIHQLVNCGTELLIDGYDGEIILNPSITTKQKFNLQYKTKKRKKAIIKIEPVSGVQIMSNINLASEVVQAIEYGSEGIGLYRTEFEFLARNQFLPKDQQATLYSKVIKAMDNFPVYFRLLDVGGDKAAEFLNLPKEDNPYLGFRGSRFLLANQMLLKTQACALAEAAEDKPLWILYPMIVDVEQFLKLKYLFQKAVKDYSNLDVKHGIMFEVPSACLAADDLLKEADFGSIGTNDLIQYLFAVDRNNEYVAYDYKPDRPVFWNLLSQIQKSAEKHKKCLSVCGEIASNPKYLKKLIQLGFSRFSVSPRLISGLRIELS